MMGAAAGKVMETAAFWDARLRSPLCTPHDLVQFAAWRDAEPEHEQAYRLLQTGLESLHDAYPDSTELRTLHQDALRASRRRMWRHVSAAAGIALAVVVASGLWRYGVDGLDSPPTPAAISFQTAAGDRSDIVLSDGSRITLNTRSKVEAIYSADRRTVRLLEGQALFEVAKDAARPFEVIVGGQRIVAVGTVFDVRLDPTRLQLTMLEGRVKVSPAKAKPEHGDRNAEKQVVAGERLYASRQTNAVWTEAVDPASAVLWREGKVEFDHTPLAEAVAEMNRYSSLPIVLEDQTIANLPISGMFFTAKPENFATALASYFPLKAESTNNRIILKHR